VLGAAGRRGLAAIELGKLMERADASRRRPRNRLSRAVTRRRDVNYAE